MMQWRDDPITGSQNETPGHFPYHFWGISQVGTAIPIPLTQFEN
jgi:hypothetical protein